MKIKWLIFCFAAILTSGCKKYGEPTPQISLVLRFKFDSSQVRLDSLGQPSVIPPGRAAQSPVMHRMSTHYIELAPDSTTQLGKGVILYRGPETEAGGDTAIDFSQSIFAANNEVFFAIPIKNIPPGDYQWLRISLAYQNFDVRFHIDTTILGDTINQDMTGTVASFLGYNTFIGSYTINTSTITVNDNRKQGYWGFETNISAGGMSQVFDTTGQIPEGNITVVNPIHGSSPIPRGSCVVTGAFMPGKLTITGNETTNIIVEVSLSTNNSFEWNDMLGNGLWDPLYGEEVVDMGIRGMIPNIQQ